MNDWGFKNEESKKIFEARWKKKQDNKGKKKLTADEKYQKFMALKEINERKRN